MTPSERVAAWKKANPERAREHNRASVARWRERNPDRVAAHRAAEREDYGITVEDIARLEERQDYACAVCLERPKSQRLAIDHDHATGRVRGLLCRNCNLALGMLADDPERLRRAVAYLGGTGDAG